MGEKHPPRSTEMVDVSSSLTAKSSRDVKGKRKAVEEEPAEGSSEDEMFASRKVQNGTAALRGMPSLKRVKGVKGGGSFQSMGLSPVLLRSLLMRGFTTPTPIQRAALPAILASPPRDLVGMARTGSGKTLAYLVPLLERLGMAHSSSFGARALIMVPTRELALQVLLVAKDLARGSQVADTEPLRWGMIVGGDSLEDQFSLVASNPDVIIATPGRLLHVAVEMKLELKAVEYVVFDEADRLFELGFATQLHEILHRLPTNRQTLLFSATLPKSLVEFAKAGLQNPKLVRLDSESKISTDLRMAFFAVKPVEKEAALLCLLRDIIGVPTASGTKPDPEEEHKRKKRKSNAEAPTAELASHQTLIFTATKHHVEYLTALMTAAGYAVSAIYGSLDHTARKIQLSAFRNQQTQILCVTDLAARGIDIPILENVINYDFPVGARTFVHRVGRTARAGRKGWAYSLVTHAELAHLLDLQLFLSRPLVQWSAEQVSTEVVPNYCESLVLGSLPRDSLDAEVEHCRHVLVETDPSLPTLQGVAERGQKMYERSCAKASAESHRRAKELAGAVDRLASHPVFKGSTASSAADLLAKIKAFRPQETVFEIGSRGRSAGAQMMKERRKLMGKKGSGPDARPKAQPSAIDEEIGPNAGEAMVEADEEDLQEVFEMSKSHKRGDRNPQDFRDPENYLDYAQAGAASEKGYSLANGLSNFVADANRAAFALPGSGQGEADEGELAPQRASVLRWDRKTKRIIKGDGVGSDNKKLIRTESGARLPASFQSGRFEEWKSKQRLRLPKIGESELPRAKSMAPQTGRQYRHRATIGKEAVDSKRGAKDGHRKARSSLQKGRNPGKGVAGLRSLDEMARERRQKEKRKWRSSGPGKKGRGK